MSQRTGALGIKVILHIITHFKWQYRRSRSAAAVINLYFGHFFLIRKKNDVNYIVILVTWVTAISWSVCLSNYEHTQILSPCHVNIK